MYVSICHNLALLCLNSIPSWSRTREDSRAAAVRSWPSSSKGAARAYVILRSFASRLLASRRGCLYLQPNSPLSTAMEPGKRVAAAWQYFSLIRPGEGGSLLTARQDDRWKSVRGSIFNHIHGHYSFLRDVFRWESGPSLAIHRRTGYGVQSGILHRQERRVCETKSPKGGIEPR